MVTNQYPTQKKPDSNPAVMHQVIGLRKLGVEVDVCHTERALGSRFTYLKMLKPLREAWASGHYDLMHVQFGGVQALAGAVLGKKTSVITYHGSDLHGGAPATTMDTIASKTTVWCSRAAAHLAGGVAVVSPNLIAYIPGGIRARTRVFPPGVDYELFSPQRRKPAIEALSLHPDRQYVLFSDIGSSPVKRRDLASAVINEVKASAPLAELLLLSGRPYWEVPSFLSAADCLLLTSDREGSPNIVKEALAMNLPIVSVDVGDVALRCQGVAGCHIVPREIEALAGAVLATLSGGRLQNSREVKRREIDNAVICSQVHAFYKQVLSSRGTTYE